MLDLNIFFAIYNQREIFMINKYVRFIEEGEEV